MDKKLKALIFIDGSNTYFAQKKIGKWLDWVKVKTYFEKQYKVLEHRYYVGLRKDDKKAGKFLIKLKKIGFKVITKPVKLIIDETGKTREKANFDVEITADLLTYSKLYSTFILISGDSDFAYLYKFFDNKRKMLVYATRKTLAWELKLVGHYFFLEDISDLTKERSFVKL